DKATGKEQMIRIEASSGLTKDEIEKMLHDAEAHAEEDTRKKEKIERRNHADAMVFEIEKQMKEYGDKVAPDDRSRLDDAVSDMKKALEGEDDDLIKQKFESLQETWKQFGEAFYKQQQAQQQAAGSDGQTGETAGKADSGGDEANTVDADYEVVDD
ncbi:MAG: Hsp70 family protein, partial [Candidatus Aegiribacteria sp.]|nr:Hsp70 family protein [Candidatus Aegiribacteria sp.]